MALDIHTRQYRSLTLAETDENDACSVREIQQGSDSINNVKMHVRAYKLISEIGNPLVQSPSADTDETVMLQLGRHFIEDGFTSLRYWSQHKRTAGSGGDSCTWKLVISDGWLYAADEVYDSTAVSNETTATWTTSSDDYSDPASTGTIDVTAIQGRDVWLFLTAANSTATARAGLYTLDVQLEA